MERVPTRDGFGNELVEIAKTNKKIYVFSGDLEDATRAEYFKHAYPERFFNLGIAEQDVVGMAAGLSKMGFVTFATSFAVFLTNRAYDMIRIDVCYNDCNVKVVCSHTGVTVGEDGATAQCLEDFALMRVLPNMVVICPMDEEEARKATRAMVDHTGPVYMRTSRAPFPVLTDAKTPFKIGKANVMRTGKDVTIIACGLMVYEALQAADTLAKEGVEAEVINMHTIKPIDREAIVQSVKKTGAVVTVEEHQVNGGLGSAVAEVLSTAHPAPLNIMGVEDTFGETGDPQGLLMKFKLKDTFIAESALDVIKKKTH